jgi:hypothetical protein
VWRRSRCGAGAYLNAVAVFVLDRTLSSGDIDATQLADAARQLCAPHHQRGSEALRGREAVVGQAGSRRGRIAGCAEREAERREPLNGPRRRCLATAAQSNLTKSLKIS